MPAPAVTLYTRVGCHLCDVAKGVLDDVRRERTFELAMVDVDTDPKLAERYGGEVPVVMVDGRKAFKFRVDPAAFRARLDRAEAGELTPAHQKGDSSHAVSWRSDGRCQPSSDKS